MNVSIVADHSQSPEVWPTTGDLVACVFLNQHFQGIQEEGSRVIHHNPSAMMPQAWLI
jgi:hypothetical protein